MARKVSFKYSNANLSLDEVHQTYLKVKSSIETKYSKEKNAEYIKCFLGKTLTEVNAERDALLNEIGIESSLILFASVEAILRTDFINRCQLKKKDKLAIFYRSGYNSKKRIYSYGLSDVVFKGWKLFLPKDENLIKQVNDAFQYRNWLAHGRYWELNLSLSRYDYYTVYDLLNLFLIRIEPYLVL